MGLIGPMGPISPMSPTTRHRYFARLRYCSVRVSICTTSPILMNGGTVILWPVSRVAGLYWACAVAPFLDDAAHAPEEVHIFDRGDKKQQSVDAAARQRVSTVNLAARPCGE